MLGVFVAGDVRKGSVTSSDLGGWEGAMTVAFIHGFLSRDGQRAH